MSKFSGDQGYQAFRILQVAFVIAPIVAGFDKFFYVLTNWSQYLSPMAMQMIDSHDRAFFAIVGVIEIIAGIGVLFKPKVFAYIVSVWILCIVLNLLTLGHFYDIVLRDVGLMLSAFALGRLAQKYDL
ncbi:MAG: hypothetical protein JSS10_00685 [Verrucomicrobia bacterium]|nr:hypothetical protein [Verrucomicrobiota bacterium]